MIVAPYTCEHYYRPDKYDEGVGTVRVWTGKDEFIEFTHIRYEANRMENGFLVMENDAMNESVYHVPNVLYWEIVY